MQFNSAAQLFRLCSFPWTETCLLVFALLQSCYLVQTVTLQGTCNSFYTLSGLQSLLYHFLCMCWSSVCPCASHLLITCSLHSTNTALPNVQFAFYRMACYTVHYSVHFLD
ncbi:hypothetical protein XELAEV_18035006mg [Xenopus laevis]|uniref:Uncharacterized protein n=1 Tax=Xenopus laevis TaxID=8355 RepID=A0A974CEY1_XENLA|nr:hypothetical protein XELAEV_18035006mg [Xenopus laevis]